MTTLHVHARDIARHDAVGNFVRQVGALAAGAGYRVRYWAEHAEPFDGLAISPSRDLARAAGPGDVIFSHFSIFDPVLADIAALPNRKILYFHNITPPDLIEPADTATIDNCARGLAQRGLATAFDVLLANSTESADMLLAGMGGARREVIVCPPVVDAARWDGVAAAPAAMDGSGRRRLLYVGRLVRHKGVLDLLDLFECLVREDPGYALDIVGNPASGAYAEAVRGRAAEIVAATGAPIAVHHGVSDAALKGFWMAASAAITMTRHEGFCVPAADALAFGVPFFHAPSRAIAEVVGGAGIELPAGNPEAAAATVASVLADAPRLRALRDAAGPGLARLRAAADGRILLDALAGAGGS